MKTKIAAAFIAAVLLFHIAGEYTRAKAVGPAVAGLGFGVLAFNLLGVMTGRFDDTAEGIGCIIENGVEGWQKAFIGTDDTPSWFASGWQIIYDTCCSWFDSGEISSDGDTFSLTYSQYLELFNLVGNSVVTDSVEFTTDYEYNFFRAEPGFPYALDSSMSILDGTEEDHEMFYVNVFYSQDTIYFPLYYFDVNFSRYDDSRTRISSFLYQTFLTTNGIFDLQKKTTLSNSFPGGVYNYNYLTFFSKLNYILCFSSSKVSISTQIPNFSARIVETDIPGWVTFGETVGTFKLVDQPDFSNLNMGIINGRGDYRSFLNSLEHYSVTKPVDLDDLSDVLPLDKTTDPTFVVDTDPSIVNPYDAVLVTDVPGNPDMTLSEYKANTRIDIDIPSVICTKFPFCIPFDLMRILGVFLADPKPPVFRIPISTDPSALEPFKGNQTIGDIPEDYEPLFNIDEEIVIDFSCIPLVQPICYTVFIVGFVILLIYVTPKMINH